MPPYHPSKDMSEKQLLTKGKLYAKRNSWTLYKIHGAYRFCDGITICEVVFEGTARAAHNFIEKNPLAKQCTDFRFVPDLEV